MKMVNERVNIRDKYRVHKKVIKIGLIVFGVLLVLLVTFAAGFLLNKGKKIEIVLKNPIAGIVLKYTDELGYVNKEAVVQEAIVEFNEDYINYLLAALGVGYLHKAALFGNPILEFDLGGEVWNSEIINGMPNSKKGSIDDEDLKISISKEEAVEALLSENIEEFMKQAVINGNTKIEMVAGKAELFSKGYLDMYTSLTGEEVSGG